MSPEYSSKCDVAKMAKMGKEFLSMARTGDRFSDGKMINIWTRRRQETGRRECASFDPMEYRKSAARYVERRRCGTLQRNVLTDVEFGLHSYYIIGGWC